MIILLILVINQLFVSNNGLSINMVNNGCSAYDCKRSCLSTSDLIETPGDNGFKFEIDGLKDDKYMPDSVYKG
jgi:hypothetical protein